MTKSLVVLTFLAGSVVGGTAMRLLKAESASPRVFELRTYTVADGQLPALHGRFRDHTMRLFAQQGMTSVGYWTPLDTTLARTTLVYLLAYPDQEAATRSWAAFRADTTWQRVRAATEAAGLRVLRVESQFVRPTDFSPMQ